MGTGQMILTIGAIILLGNIMITTNRAIGKSSDTLLESGYQIASISIATSTLERAQSLPFDENTQDSTWTSSLSGLTPPSSLGQENGDTADLDDYDDFNGISHNGVHYRLETDTLTAPDSSTYGIYKIETTVQYVTRRQSDGAFVPSTTSATWAKQLDVYVWNVADSAGTSVHMFDIFCYWY
jgi:hypothetical protein